MASSSAPNLVINFYNCNYSRIYRKIPAFSSNLNKKSNIHTFLYQSLLKNKTRLPQSGKRSLYYQCLFTPLKPFLLPPSSRRPQ